jgi:RNA polymerase sigma-70 factor, ECF subfamily
MDVMRKVDEPPAAAEPDRPEDDGGELVDFDLLYHAHFRSLTVQVAAYCGDATHAQDIVQEAFCRAFARWSRIRRYEDPVAWIRRVAWNLATSRARRLSIAQSFLRRQRIEHTPGPNPDRVALAAALASLPSQQRRAVVLHYLADMSIVDVARQEGVPEGTVKSWLHRARAALAAQLSDARGGEA